MSEKKINRRDYLKYAGAAVGGLVVGGALGYLTAPGKIEKVTETITKTETTTAAAATVTQTVTKTVTPTPVTTPKVGEIRILAWQTTIDDLYKKLIEEDFTPKTGIKVLYETPAWGAYTEKNLASLKAEKSPYDIIINNTEWTLPAWAFAGKLMPLNDYIKRDFKVEDFLSGFLGICAYPPGGKIKPTGFYSDFAKAEFYGVPYFADSEALVYRTDLFEDKGITKPPKDWDEFLDIAKELTNPDKKIWGFTFYGAAKGNAIYDSWFKFIHSWGANVFDENLDPAFNTSEGIEATQFLVDLYLKHKVVPPGTPTFDHEAVMDTYKAGMAAMMIFWGNTPLGDIPIAKVSRYAVCPVKKRVATRTAGAAFTIPRTASNPDLAWEYIKWALSPSIRRIAVGELGAPAVLTAEIAYAKEGSNAWAVAQTVARPDVGVSPAIPNLIEAADAISPFLNRALIGEISVKDAL
ncbi:MAG: sugar ABC transporter substrate-binding protein, partial [Nitrososphaerota archaeon]